MSKTPLVSIILPTYNGSRYLEQSIQSCLEQTYQNWELIIVDDASTDNTPEIISLYLSKDERIHSIRHEKNRKLPGALNSGFAQARGIYLTWTSDDNCYRPMAIVEMVNYLVSHPETDIVYANYTTIDDDGHIIKPVDVKGANYIYMGNCVGPCFLYRRLVQEKLGTYAEDLFLAEDYDFWLRAAVSFTFHPLPQDLYLYRNHGTSLSMKKRKGILRATERTFKRNLPIIQWLTHDMHAEAWLNLARGALYSNNLNLTRKYLLYAITCSPAFMYRNNHDLLITNYKLAEKDAEKDQQLAEKDQQLAEKDQQLAEKDRQLVERDRQLVEKDQQLAEKDRYIQRLLNSYSWRITVPLRVLHRYLLRMK